MADITDTLQVNGIRCEGCVARLASTLQDRPGLAAAHANLMGEVTLTWDDEVTTRAELVDVLARSGFHERVPA